MCHTIHALFPPSHEDGKQFYLLKKADIPHYGEMLADFIYQCVQFFASYPNHPLCIHFYTLNYDYSNEFMMVLNSNVSTLSTWPSFSTELPTLIEKVMHAIRNKVDFMWMLDGRVVSVLQE